MTQQSLAERGKNLSQIWGRGLFYGESDAHGKRRIFTEAEWNNTCAQAKTWGMSFVHPKVADGPNVWFSVPDLQMLARVAKDHGLTCYPYHYCYGNTDGSSVTQEARICSMLGVIFGGVCPDIEIEWERAGRSSPSTAAQWATDFGKTVRSTFKGPVLPTLFANPEQHAAFPYAELLSWCSGWLPMVYFDIWTTAGKPDSAQDAINFVNPQWQRLAAALVAKSCYAAPILPLIEVGPHLSSSEVASWLSKTQHFGYCGFWYDGLYAPFAASVLASPEPAWDIQAPTPPPPPPVPMPLPNLPGMDQGLSTEDLAACLSLDGSISLTSSDPFYLLWASLTNKGYGIGAITGPVEQRVVNGLAFQVLSCEGGRLWYNPREKRVWVQLVSQTRIPGAPTPSG